MNVDNKIDPVTVISRFSFVDEETFKIVSEDGIEKLVHIDNGFIELGYNYIPLFKEINGEEYKTYPYYSYREFDDLDFSKRF